jgi:hypothetical protein
MTLPWGTNLKLELLKRVWEDLELSQPVLLRCLGPQEQGLEPAQLAL